MFHENLCSLESDEDSYDDFKPANCSDLRYYVLAMETLDKLDSFIAEHESYVIFNQYLTIIGFFSFENPKDGSDNNVKHINRFWLSSFYRSWNNIVYSTGVPELALSCYLRMQDTKEIYFSVDLPPDFERTIRWAKCMGFSKTSKGVGGLTRYSGKATNTFMV